MTIEKKRFILKGVDFSMDRFFDLQLFAGITNISSGKDGEPYLLSKTEDGNEDNFTNVGSYVNIVGRDGVNDTVLTSGSKYVTVDAKGGADNILASVADYTSIVAGEGNDVINVVGSDYVTIEGTSGKNVIDVSSSNKVVVDGGTDGDDIAVTNGSNNVTITAGLNVADTIRISTDSKNVSITDLEKADVIVLSDFTAKPRFATFHDGVLNIDGVKINLGADFGTDTVATTAVKFGNGEGEGTTLEKLLTADAPLWSATKGKTVATYTNATTGEGLATVSGVKKFGETYKDSDDLPGFTVDVNNNIILSKTVLGTGTVSLGSKDFNLKFEDDELEFTTDGDAKLNLGFSIAGASGKVKTATFKNKAKSDGYYIGDGGKKLKYSKANAVATTFTVGNLVAGTKTLAADPNGKLDGLTYTIGEGKNTGTVTISDADIFAEVAATKAYPIAHKKATIDGEDVQFNITGAVNELEIAGGKNNDHVNLASDATSNTVNASTGNDWVTDNGSDNTIDLGAGNDYMLGAYSNDVINAGAGDDYVAVAGDDNKINGLAGNDTLAITSGSDNTADLGAGNDLFSVKLNTAAITHNSVSLGAGNDSVNIIGGVTTTTTGEGDDSVTTKTYNFADNEVDVGAGNDYIYLSDIGAGNVINAGAGNDEIKIANSTGVSVGGDAGNDIFTVNFVNSTTVDGGAGNDEISLGDMTESNIQMGAGNDVIDVLGGQGEKNVINAGAGNDIITVGEVAQTNNTISAGFGNDVINVDVANKDNYAGSVFQYDYGAGNVTITGFTEKDILNIAGTGESVSDPVLGSVVKSTKVGKTTVKETLTAYTVSVGKGKAAGTITFINPNFATADTTTDDGDGDADTGTDTDSTASGDTSSSGDALSETETSEVTTESLIASHIVKNSQSLDKQLTWTVNKGTATGKLNGVTVATIKGLKVASSTETDTKKKNAAIAAQNAAIAAAISDDGERIIISAGAIDAAKATKDTKITLDKTAIAAGYRFAIGDDFADLQSKTTQAAAAEPKTEEGITSIDFGTTTLSEGFVLSKDKHSFTYRAEPENITGPKISGLNANVVATDVVWDGGETVILSAGALPTVTLKDEAKESDTGITIAGKNPAGTAYKLALNEDEEDSDGKVTISKSGDEKWEFDVDENEAESTVTKAANRVSAFTTEGYYMKNGSILYRTNQDKNILVTVRGLSFGTEGSDLSVTDGDNDSKIITVAKKALASKTTDQTTIYIDDDGISDYTLALPAKGVTLAKLAAEGWKASGTTSYYQDRKISKNGYAVSDDGKSIDYYTDDYGGNTMLTLTGLKKNAGTDANLKINKENHTVTIKNAALNKTNVSIEFNEDYEGSDGGTYYTIVPDDDVDRAVTTEADWYTVSGGVQYVTEKVTTAGYKLDEETGDLLYKAVGGGKTEINITGLNASVKETDVYFSTTTTTGASTTDNEGNDDVPGETTTTDAYDADGKRIVVLKTDLIKAPGTKATPVGATVKGTGYVYQLDGDGGKAVYNSGGATKFIGSAGKDSLYGGTGKDTLNGGAGDDYLSGGNGNDILDGGEGKDELFGGNGNDTLTGSAGENVLNGGNGNDSLIASEGTNNLTGGVGNDTFHHIGGKTTITDYAAGADKIKVTVAGVSSSEDLTSKVSISGADVIFNFNTDNTVTVKNGKNKVITVVSGSDTTLAKKKYTVTETTAESGNLIVETVNELWFDDDSEFISADSLSNVTEIEVIGGELESSQPEKLTQENLVTYGG